MQCKFHLTSLLSYQRANKNASPESTRFLPSMKKCAVNWAHTIQIIHLFIPFHYEYSNKFHQKNKFLLRTLMQSNVMMSIITIKYVGHMLLIGVVYVTSMNRHSIGPLLRPN